MDYQKLAKSVHEAQNKLRTNPQSFIPKLEEMLKHFKGTDLERPGRITLMTNEGAKAVKECIEVLKKTKPLCELAFNDGLARACQDHVNDIGPKGITGHKGSDGSGLMDRVKRYLQAGFVGENIDFGSETGEEVVISLIVDDGVPSRGHRNNMLNPEFNMVGIACGLHKVYRNCTVLDYARGSGSTQTTANPVLTKKPTTQIRSSSNQPVNKNPLSTQKSQSGTQLQKKPTLTGVTKTSTTTSTSKIGTTTNQQKTVTSSKSPSIGKLNTKPSFGDGLMNDPFVSQQLAKMQAGFGANLAKMSQGMGPSGSVGMSVKTMVSVQNGKRTTKTITTYQYANGSTKEEIKEVTENV